MTLARYAAGTGALLLIVGALGWGSHRLRLRVLPDWSGAPALLAEVVLFWAALIGIAQLLGVVGAFALFPLVAACVVVGIGAAILAGNGLRKRTARAVTPESPRSLVEVVLAVSAVAIALGTWIMATARVLPYGIGASDSLQYHLPQAARFAQDGFITNLHFSVPEFPDAFHPANNELVLAIGMLLFRSDVLAPLVNLVWLLCLLLAGWCFGTSTRMQPMTLAATALVAALPGFARDQPGTATNDVAAIFFIVACAALVQEVPKQRWALALAGACAGLAVGTKLTTIAVVAAITLGMWIVSARESGGRAIAVWTLPMIGGGALWYVRNLATTGSPVPGMDTGIVPYAGYALVDELGYRVVDYARDVDAWTSWFAPALDRFFGPLWWVVLILLAAVTILAIVRGSAVVRVLAVAVVVGIVAYAFAPTSALGPLGRPFLFEGNLVYAMPAVTLGALLAPVVLRASSARARIAFLSLALVLIVVAQFSARSPWRLGPALVGVVAIVVVAAIAVGAISLRPPSRPALAACLAALAVGGSFLVGWYDDHRYTDDPLAVWADGVSGSRIAQAGLTDMYRLYDAELTNHVEFVGSRGPHGAIRPATSCERWRSALRDGRFDYVVLRPGDFSSRSPADHVEVEIGLTSVGERELRWTRTDPGAEELRRIGRNIIFSFDPDVPDPGC